MLKNQGILDEVKSNVLSLICVFQHHTSIFFDYNIEFKKIYPVVSMKVLLYVDEIAIIWYRFYEFLWCITKKLKYVATINKLIQVCLLYCAFNQKINNKMHKLKSIKYRIKCRKPQNTFIDLFTIGLQHPSFISSHYNIVY